MYKGELANPHLPVKLPLKQCMCVYNVHCAVVFLGMSVKIANMSGEKWYIGGAPRSKYYGQVLMFRQHDAPYLLVERQHILVGVQFGEGFGYDIAVADFNGDG